MRRCVHCKISYQTAIRFTLSFSLLLCGPENFHKHNRGDRFPLGAPALMMSPQGVKLGLVRPDLVHQRDANADSAKRRRDANGGLDRNLKDDDELTKKIKFVELAVMMSMKMKMLE
ncbi:hypothetical protein HN51_039181 [Arachis hypogaea]